MPPEWLVVSSAGKNLAEGLPRSGEKVGARPAPVLCTTSRNFGRSGRRGVSINFRMPPCAGLIYRFGNGY